MQMMTAAATEAKIWAKNASFNLSSASVVAGAQNASDDEQGETAETLQSYGFYFASLCLALVTILTILGNLLVMIAILKTKTLRSTQYIFIFCLATTDLCLGLLVLPFATYYEMTQSWAFGTVLCNVWVSLDVMLCSGSVLHLLFITIDRKLAIKYAIEYRFVVTKPRIAMCMILVWVISIGNSFLPIFLGWNTADGSVQNTRDPTQCGYDMGNKWYCLIVGLVTFIIPLLVMALMYIDILHMARIQSKKIREQTVFVSANSASNDVQNSSGRFSKSYSNNNKNTNNNSTLEVPGTSSSADASGTINGGASAGTEISSRPSVSSKRRQPPRTSVAIHKLMNNVDTIYRENKATVTVFVIFGLFFICWFPYMVLFTFWPLKGNGLQTVNPIAMKIFVWTGYVNSTVNPFLYTMLNTTFRDALKKLFSTQRKRQHADDILDLGVANGLHVSASGV